MAVCLVFLFRCQDYSLVQRSSRRLLFPSGTWLARLHDQHKDRHPSRKLCCKMNNKRGATHGERLQSGYLVYPLALRLAQAVWTSGHHFCMHTKLLTLAAVSLKWARKDTHSASLQAQNLARVTMPTLFRSSNGTCSQDLVLSHKPHKWSLSSILGSLFSLIQNWQKFSIRVSGLIL